jgi:hypothetical protein
MSGTTRQFTRGQSETCECSRAGFESLAAGRAEAGRRRKRRDQPPLTAYGSWGDSPGLGARLAPHDPVHEQAPIRCEGHWDHEPFWITRSERRGLPLLRTPEGGDGRRVSPQPQSEGGGAEAARLSRLRWEAEARPILPERPVHGPGEGGNADRPFRSHGRRSGRGQFSGIPLTSIRWRRGPACVAAAAKRRRRRGGANVANDNCDRGGIFGRFRRKQSPAATPSPWKGTATFLSPRNTGATLEWSGAIESCFPHRSRAERRDPPHREAQSSWGDSPGLCARLAPDNRGTSTPALPPSLRYIATSRAPSPPFGMEERDGERRRPVHGPGEGGNADRPLRTHPQPPSGLTRSRPACPAAIRALTGPLFHHVN